MNTKYTTARLSVGGEHFEVLVDPETALNYKLGKASLTSKILVVDIIFSDASKGMRASEEKLQRAFQTVDSLEVAKIILRRGELLFTADQRRKMVEDKKKQIINYISRHCADPRTGLPHPPIRIEQAIEQIHIAIDPFKDAEEQAKSVIDKLRPILPLKIEQIEIAVKIPPEYAAVSIGAVRDFGRIVREEWQADGSWIAVVEMPSGLRASFLERLGRITRGNLQTKILS